MAENTALDDGIPLRSEGVPGDSPVGAGASLWMKEQQRNITGNPKIQDTEGFCCPFSAGPGLQHQSETATAVKRQAEGAGVSLTGKSVIIHPPGLARWTTPKMGLNLWV